MQEDTLTYHQSNDTLLDNKGFLDSYFSKEYSSSKPLFPKDSCQFYSLQPQLKHKSLSQQPQILDWIFCIFLILFILLSSIGKKIGLPQSITEEFFAVKKRKSIFYEPTTNEWYGKLLLCLQTCILIAIFLYKTFTDNSIITLNTPIEVLNFIGISTLILCAFLFVKWVSYSLVDMVFFDKATMRIWISKFFSIFAFSGIVLFIPILLYFYVEMIRSFCFYFVIIYFLLFEAFIVYKSFVLFFYKPSSWLNLFLYLCSQEIIPLFFLWRALVMNV